jgi:hypothetical protein
MRTGLRATVLEHLAAIGCGVLAAVVLTALYMPHGHAEEPVYQEKLIQPVPDVGQLPSVAYDPKADCGCTAGASGTGYDLWLPRNKAGTSPYYASLIGGSSYFNAPDQTSGGGLLGVQVAVPILDRTGVLANGAVNVYDGGTQYSGGLGAYRNPTYYGSPSDRVGGSIIFYQFTDTRLNNPYLVMGSYSLDYSILPGVRAGLRYFDPIHGGTATLPGGGTIEGGQLMIESVEATLKLGSVRRHLNLAAGYSDQFNSGVFQVDLARPVTRRISAVANAYYAERLGYWWGFLGFQVDLSPRDQPQFAAYGRSRDVVRGDAASIYASFGIDQSGENDPDANAASAEIMEGLQRNDFMQRVFGGGGGGQNCNCPNGWTFEGNSGPDHIVCSDDQSVFHQVSCD